MVPLGKKLTPGDHESSLKNSLRNFSLQDVLVLKKDSRYDLIEKKANFEKRFFILQFLYLHYCHCIIIILITIKILTCTILNQYTYMYHSK